jgi:plasmid stability protein
MKTLYLRNVPDEVGERLAALAAREGMSVSAFVVRALDEVARRADNRALLADLPDLPVTIAEILDDLDAGRAER